MKSWIHSEVKMELEIRFGCVSTNKPFVVSVLLQVLEMSLWKCVPLLERGSFDSKLAS